MPCKFERPLQHVALVAFLLAGHLAAAALAAEPTAAAYDDCTIVSVGKLASVDGSVMTSQTCDGHDGKTWIDVVPERRHAPGDECPIYLKTDHRQAPGDTAGTVYRGSLPEIERTNGYILGFYPLMNEHQLAIGESTFGGKKELRSDKGLLDCYELTRLIAERATTAREAIHIADELLMQYGYNDAGEALTFADPNEVWLMEIVGPGKDRVGAVWAAQRIPDDHISVSANASRIRNVDRNDPDNFLASKNVVTAAVDLGLWDPQSDRQLEFCYTYANRKSMSCRRREWRVFDLLAPSGQWDPNGENFPFSIKPDTLVSARDIMRVFSDTYEGTDFDMTQYMLVPDEEGRLVKSPYANPFMNYDQMPLWRITGGWGRKGERTLARFYCIYAFVSQSRSWLPDEIGGLVWIGWDNPAMTCYVPMYCRTARLPESYRLGGPPAGRPAYTRDSAWWAFNRVSGIAAHRWGDMRRDVAAVRDPLLDRFFAEQAGIEAEALELHGQGDPGAVDYLSRYTVQLCDEVVTAYWRLGDDLWTRYDEKF
jgi:dipeptidase